ncbi:hypothetical protein [Actinoplanes flavus]|uniref:Uncharacterized protein n=1 Tax=Actinoplanes flavus TaxID=2820290 RepID=A0ABS3UN92_9ACTN|nr:hypothetical protein [Actinoplanes flavus]MBO3740242.1 hypothetical protein [Actinoplanes flavus]
MDQTTTRTVVLARALPAAFESACLVECVDTARPQRPSPLRPVPRSGEALAEFDRAEAADRLAFLLTDLGCAAARETWSGGGRRRYQVQRVLVQETQRLATSRMLETAWRQGRQALLDSTSLGASSPRHAQRLALAQAAWRAALLAAGQRRRRDLIWVTVRDQEIAAVLVRAARLLGATAMVTRRSGCVVVTVSAEAADLLPATPPRLGLRSAV